MAEAQHTPSLPKAHVDVLKARLDFLDGIWDAHELPIPTDVLTLTAMTRAILYGSDEITLLHAQNEASALLESDTFKADPHYDAAKLLVSAIRNDIYELTKYQNGVDRAAEELRQTLEWADLSPLDELSHRTLALFERPDVLGLFGEPAHDGAEDSLGDQLKNAFATVNRIFTVTSNPDHRDTPHNQHILNNRLNKNMTDITEILYDPRTLSALNFDSTEALLEIFSTYQNMADELRREPEQEARLETPRNTRGASIT